MSTIAPLVPVDAAPLCEACGYILTGLSETGACPECGQAVSQSTGEHRRPSSFEAAPSLWTLAKTASAVSFHPSRFFRSLTTRHDTRAARWFARAHRIVAAALLAAALCGIIEMEGSVQHWLYQMSPGPDARFPFNMTDEPEIFGLLLAPVVLIAYAVIATVTGVVLAMVIRVSRERAMPLQPAVVKRASKFHSVHWMFAAFAIAVAVGGPLSLLVTPMAVMFYIVIGAIAARLAGGHAFGRKYPIAIGAALTVVMLLTATWYFAQFGDETFDRVGEPPADWPSFLTVVTVVTAICILWLAYTAWIAIKNVRYANA